MSKGLRGTRQQEGLVLGQNLDGLFAILFGITRGDDYLVSLVTKFDIKYSYFLSNSPSFQD